MEVDVHKVITSLFNVELNRFLARFDKERMVETVRTGGLMEIKVREAHLFKEYVDWLKAFREDLIHISVDHKLDLESFQKLMEPLLKFYVDLGLLMEYNVFTKESEIDLDIYFLKPFARFLHGLDKYLGTIHFTERVNDIRGRLAEVIVRVINAFNLPISEVELQLYYIRHPEFKEYARKYPLCVTKTDENGKARTKLTWGHYRIDIERYRKIILLDVDGNREVKVKVFDPIHLLRHAMKS